MNEDLLKRARNEIVEELHFTEKETDIYKVNQTGDLANLDGLSEEEAGRLKSLMELRNAIYSDEFRDWIRRVTGCGPLSAKKKDMSINDYRHGCHLLNHDDVISTRRVSYILYLPDPAEAWQPSWGGALELYPVKEKHVPDDVPSRIVPPQWNQFTFFVVQPGHSFHSVEEVVRATRRTAEGVVSCRSLLALARSLGVDVPITEAVAAVVTGALRPQELAATMFRRARKAESG